MKIEKIINKYTRNNGDYIPDYNYENLIKDIKKYTKKKCKQQRRLCAEKYYNGGNYSSINNTPEPEFD